MLFQPFFSFLLLSALSYKKAPLLKTLPEGGEGGASSTSADGDGGGGNAQDGGAGEASAAGVPTQTFVGRRNSNDISQVNFIRPSAAEILEDPFMTSEEYKDEYIKVTPREKEPDEDEEDEVCTGTRALTAIIDLHFTFTM